MPEVGGIERRPVFVPVRLGKLAAAVLLKFFQFNGRFPRYHLDVPGYATALRLGTANPEDILRRFTRTTSSILPTRHSRSWAAR